MASMNYQIGSTGPSDFNKYLFNFRYQRFRYAKTTVTRNKSSLLWKV